MDMQTAVMLIRLSLETRIEKSLTVVLVLLVLGQVPTAKFEHEFRRLVGPGASTLVRHLALGPWFGVQRDVYVPR